MDVRAEFKKAAAVAAARAEVRTGMVVGLGSGTTVFFLLDELARRIREEGLVIRGVPSSLETERLARERGIPLTDLNETPDVDIDGADEIDPRFMLIKGGGGALTREKCVAQAARALAIIVDESKLVRHLARPLPLEVIPFAEPFVLRRLSESFPESRPVTRFRDGVPYTTDSGNHIVDLAFPDGMPDPRTLDRKLKGTCGVVEHGLFIGMSPRVYVAGADGVRVLG